MSAVGAANCRIDGCLRACREPETPPLLDHPNMDLEVAPHYGVLLLLVHEHSANEKWRAASQPPWMRP